MMNDDLKRIAEQIETHDNSALEELRKQALEAQAAIPRDAFDIVDSLPKVQIPTEIVSAALEAREMTQKLGGIVTPIIEVYKSPQMNDAITNAARVVIEATQQFADGIAPIAAAVARFQEQISISMEPIIKAFNNFNFSIPKGVLDSLQRFAESSRPMSTIVKLAKAQYVYWDYLEDGFIEIIYNSKNVNKTLREYHEKDKFLLVDVAVNKCLALLAEKHTKRLFEQAVFSYKNKQYDIAAVGLISVIDALLTSVSGDTGTSIFKRADAILVRIEHDDEISSDEYSVIALTWTFRETMESLCADSDFTLKEPRGLNRHWIAHGRSIRRKTRLDCIKLINFIYGILLISAFGEKEYKT